MSIDECKHEHLFSMPDSLARVCEACGQVFIEGKPWGYKSGHIMEWVKDLVEAKEKKEAEDGQ
jgi:hypothetical protein